MSTKIADMPILSIRTGNRVGNITKPIINPHNLHLDAFYCQNIHSKDLQILLDIDIRDISDKGLIINDYSSFSEPDELIRLKPVLDLNFELKNKTVISSGKKLGKVAEYSFDTATFFVQNLYVQPAAWKSISINRLTINRNSIIEVTDSHIVVSGPEEKFTPKVKLASNQQELSGYSANTSLTSE